MQFASVPETPIKEEGNAVHREHDIWASHKIEALDLESHSPACKFPAHRPFKSVCPA